MTMQVGDQSEDVRTLKQKLREGGYFTGPDDDFYGEDLAEAVRKYQTAHGLTVDGVAGAETWGNINGDPAYPNGTPGSTPAAGDGSGQYDEIKRNYPQFAYLVDDPEVGKILRDANARAKTTNPMPQSEFEAAIMATNWWRTTSSSARQYYNQQFADPASFNNKIRDYADQVRMIGNAAGFDESILTPDYINYFANKAYREGLTPTQIRLLLAQEIVPLAGTTEKSPYLHQMRELQQAYQISLDEPTRRYWIEALSSGKQTIENFRGAIMAQAKALFPNLTGQFEQGFTFKQIIEPYRKQISALLEIDPETIDFIGNPKWRNVVDYVDPKDGTHRTMSNQELSKYVKSQSEYWQTRNGKDAAGEMVEGILTDFGAVKR